MRVAKISGALAALAGAVWLPGGRPVAALAVLLGGVGLIALSAGWRRLGAAAGVAAGLAALATLVLGAGISPNATAVCCWRELPWCGPAVPAGHGWGWR